LLAANLREAREFLGGAPPNLALLDLELPDGRGLELLPALSRSRTTEIVFISGHATVSSAVHALKEGASDFLEKPVELRRLRSILRRVRALQLPEFEPAVVRERIATEGRLGALVGRSPQMLAVYEQILKVGPTSATVMISGATGTGKELVAQTLHEMSSRVIGFSLFRLLLRCITPFRRPIYGLSRMAHTCPSLKNADHPLFRFPWNSSAGRGTKLAGRFTHRPN
jgi:DNA-binding NtrC family response regulator